MVGSLACQRDSFLVKDFKTVVIKCDPAKKNSTFEVELQDTILFPEGGGQPTDTGVLRILNSQETLRVSQVQRKGLQAIHHVDKYVCPGTEVIVEVNWARRFDFMQQHTGQHLLSALLDQWGLPTLSWSMGGIATEENATVEPGDLFNYIEIGRKLKEEEILKLSELCDLYITQNPQDVEVVEQSPDSKAEVNTSKIPENYDLERGTLRTIHIGALDANPCCGTHLKSTAQIGSILISNSQSTARGSNSRLYFMCGSRVLKYGQFANSILGKSKSLLSCGESEIPEKVDWQKSTTQKTLKREQFWMKAVAEAEATRLVKKLEERKSAYVVMDEFGTIEFLTQVQRNFTLLAKEKGVHEYNVVLCGREKSSNSGAVMILSESSEAIATTSNKLLELVQTLKGGGGKKGGKWQGKVVDYGKGEWTGLCQYLSESF